MRYVSNFELPTEEPLCDPLGFWTTPLDLAILGGGEEQPWYVPVLLRTQGVTLLRADRNQPVDLKLGTGQCGVFRWPQLDANAVWERFWGRCPI